MLSDVVVVAVVPAAVVITTVSALLPSAVGSKIDLDFVDPRGDRHIEVGRQVKTVAAPVKVVQAIDFTRWGAYAATKIDGLPLILKPVKKARPPTFYAVGR